MNTEKVVSGSVFVVALIVQSCSGAPDTETVSLGSSRSALQADQGVGLQGLGMQALGMQGLGMQALGMQALGMQALGMQGLGYQGIGYQGLGYQGIGYQGIGYQGIGYQGDATDADFIAGLRLRHGELVATTLGGRSLRGTDLIGLQLPFVTSEDEIVWVRIARAQLAEDTDDVWLYGLEVDGENLCDDDGLGLFVPGVWDETGQRLKRLSTGENMVDTTFSCPAGVIAKCVLWGYRPWAVGPRLHEACTRMARADYCGDGVGYTENGTLIDMFDRRGIQTTVNAPDLSFEAGWGVDGAVCVSQPRYLDLGPNGELVLPPCWESKPECSTWEEALKLGAELGNDSAHALRPPASDAE